jgi:dimethylglycine dehydrogenase
MRWFETRLPKDGSVRVENQSLRYAGLQIAGPNARTLLQRVAEGDVGANSFPFLSGRPMEIARCPEAVAVRVSFTGELGYELYVPAEYQRVLFDELMAAGKDLGLALAGSRALLSLRLEKSFPTWAAELGPDYTPMEPGLMRFVRLDKGEFVGREALAAKSKDGPREKLSTLVVEADGVDCFGGEAVLRDGSYVGYVTSGGFGHTAGESIALAYIRTPAWEPGARYEVQLLGRNRKAVLSAKPRFDADGARMRS